MNCPSWKECYDSLVIIDLPVAAEVPYFPPLPSLPHPIFLMLSRDVRRIVVSVGVVVLGNLALMQIVITYIDMLLMPAVMSKGRCKFVSGGAGPQPLYRPDHL